MVKQNVVRAVARRGGRRPSAQVRDDVIVAAAQVLRAEGYSGFTMQKVTKRSGVSSATVHRYWKSRGVLALDGYCLLADESIPLYGTGDVERDLTRVLLEFVRVTTAPNTGSILTHLIALSHEDELLAKRFEEQELGPGRRAVRSILQEAQTGGQIRAEIDLELIVDLIWGPCYFRLLLPYIAPGLTADFAVSLVQAIVPSILSDRRY